MPSAAASVYLSLRPQICLMVQINNAGDGGLYAEMIRDRSFDASFYGFHTSGHPIRDISSGMQVRTTS